MNHRHRKVLHKIFTHPVSGNINFKAAVSVLEELGAEIDNKVGNRIGITLNGHTMSFNHSQHDLAVDGVVQLRKFLTECGIDPKHFPV